MARSAWSFAVTCFLACCVLMLTASLVPGSRGIVAVFARPGGDTALQIVASAGGRIVLVPASSWIAVTEVTDAGLVDRLYQSGAGFVASSVVAQLCARWNGATLGSAL